MTLDSKLSSQYATKQLLCTLSVLLDPIGHVFKVHILMIKTTKSTVIQTR